jgi:hypothetical protein
MSNVVMFPARASTRAFVPVDVHDARPCTGCPNFDLCYERMACLQFASFYLSRGKMLWRDAPREPTADIYARLFPNAAHA